MKKAEEVIIDFLNLKGLKIIQRNDYFNFSLDSVVIANFLTINRKTKSITDLGTGNGSIPLILSKRTNAKIYGIEIQEVSAQLAKKNVEINKLDNQIKIIHDDMNNILNHLNEQSQDAVICNPPFFKLDGNKEQINDMDQLSIARHEITINLEGIIKTASKILKNRGYFALVHRADRLPEIIGILNRYGLTPKRLQICHGKKDKPGKIITIEALKNSEASLTILPPLICHDMDGKYSKDILKMFSGEYRWK